jgi:FkbM family methyltransferase
VTSNSGGAAHRDSLVKSFFETRGQSAGVSARLYFNKVVYGLIRSMRRAPENGWLESRWHWHRFPFSMRNSVLWSPFLKAWFYPEAESAIECMLHQPDYEPLVWVMPERGSVFIDVGAYIGPYTILAAKAVGATGRVIALEPDPTNRRQLEKNLQLNGISTCTVVPLAVWSCSGRIGWSEAERPDWHRACEEASSGAIEATTLDDLVADHALDRIDWIKMDIEGGEVEALRGAQRTLARFRPALFIEIHDTIAPIRNLLGSLNYCIERESFDQPPDYHGWILARAR